MSSDRDKPSRGGESVARPTARDVPFARGPDSEAESAPRGQRPADLPRDPTYEAELALVDLAVLREPQKHEDPSTRQQGRRGQLPAPSLPESVTPESPGTRARQASLSGSPETPIFAGRAVGSGTLLSVGAVDPRGKTEKNLETPRMFFSQADAGSEVYFRPGKIPAVTVNQPVDSETVKLSDSVDPRRAKTIPRLDRGQLSQLVGGDPESRGHDSDHAVAVSPRSIPDLVVPQDSAGWQHDRYADEPDSIPSDHDGQIHASLSQFREHSAPSFSLDGAPTRPEPLAARRASEPPDEPDVLAPDPNIVPTQRDLPAHRIQASTPPPASASPRVTQRQARGSVSSAAPPASEGPTPTTASIAAAAPEPRPVWHYYAAFFAALVVALVLGMWWTRHQRAEQPAMLRETQPAPSLRDDTRAVPPAAPPQSTPPLPARGEPAVETAQPRPGATARRAWPPEPRSATLRPAAPAPVTAAPTTPAPRASNSAKPARETIF
ncbi:MAG TPA: hypothetical protein VIW29_00145 [Polyangiaceae bacterium]